MSTIGEVVDTFRELDFLRSVTCGSVQGFIVTGLTKFAQVSALLKQPDPFELPSLLKEN